METKISKKKFASVHMQNAVGKSMDSTRKALRGIHALVEHPSFDIFFAFIVFVNAIFIGFQVQSEISASMMTPIETRMVNYCFGCFFTIELICRLLHGGLAFFYSENWMWKLGFISQPCQASNFQLWRCDYRYSIPSNERVFGWIVLRFCVCVFVCVYQCLCAFLCPCVWWTL